MKNYELIFSKIPEFDSRIIYKFFSLLFLELTTSEFLIIFGLENTNRDKKHLSNVPKQSIESSVRAGSSSAGTMNCLNDLQLHVSSFHPTLYMSFKAAKLSNHIPSYMSPCRHLSPKKQYVQAKSSL